MHLYAVCIHRQCRHCRHLMIVFVPVRPDYCVRRSWLGSCLQERSTRTRLPQRSDPSLVLTPCVKSPCCQTSIFQYDPSHYCRGRNASLCYHCSDMLTRDTTILQRKLRVCFHSRSLLMDHISILHLSFLLFTSSTCANCLGPLCWTYQPSSSKAVP